MPLKFVVVNERNVRRELDRKGPELVAALNPVVKKAALRVASRMIRLVQRGSRSGRSYPRPGGTVHIASAGGEPPKSDSGFLASRINPTTVTVAGVVVSATVVVSADYGGMLQRGTSKMEPRPYADVALKLETPKINSDAAKAVQRTLR